jgi:hypothetical protein
MINLKVGGNINLQTTKIFSLFVLVDPVLHEKDIRFGNLETVQSDMVEFPKKTVPIFSLSESAQWLKKAGFDILNISNYHIIYRSAQ